MADLRQSPTVRNGCGSPPSCRGHKAARWPRQCAAFLGNLQNFLRERVAHDLNKGSLPRPRPPAKDFHDWLAGALAKQAGVARRQALDHAQREPGRTWQNFLRELHWLMVTKALEAQGLG